MRKGQILTLYEANKSGEVESRVSDVWIIKFSLRSISFTGNLSFLSSRLGANSGQPINSTRVHRDKTYPACRPQARRNIVTRYNIGRQKSDLASDKSMENDRRINR